MIVFIVAWLCSGGAGSIDLTSVGCADTDRLCALERAALVRC